MARWAPPRARSAHVVEATSSERKAPPWRHDTSPQHDRRFLWWAVEEPIEREETFWHRPAEGLVLIGTTHLVVRAKLSSSEGDECLDVRR